MGTAQLQSYLMKIGVIGPIWYNIPSKKYGGTESVVSNLVNGLSEKNHDVTLFGPATSDVKAKVHGTSIKPVFELGMDWNNNIVSQMYHITEAFDRADDFDILHMHLNKSHDYSSLLLAAVSQTPIIFTLHFPIPLRSHLENKEEHSYHRQDRLIMLEKFKMLPYTTISDAQQRPLDMNFIRTVYNSLEVSDYHFTPKSDNYFVWMGRVRKIKGTKEAILAAKEAGVALKLLGVVDQDIAGDVQYFEEEVKPLIDGKQIQWMGEADITMKNEIMGKAKAFLNPIQWEEPFGLVMTEALAMGVPVIALNRGSVPELVKDGVTGFVAENMQEFVTRIKEVEKIDRKACRDWVVEQFNNEQMIAGYEKAYDDVVTNWEAYKSRLSFLLAYF
jgi:glycosyltransferase involved in cell wall biosynthesis